MAEYTQRCEYCGHGMCGLEGHTCKASIRIAELDAIVDQALTLCHDVDAAVGYGQLSSTCKATTSVRLIREAAEAARGGSK